MRDELELSVGRENALKQDLRDAAARQEQRRAWQKKELAVEGDVLPSPATYGMRTLLKAAPAAVWIGLTRA